MAQVLGRVTVRFWVSLGLTMLVIGLALAALRLGGNVYSPGAQRLAGLVQFVLATPVVFWGGWPHFRRAWASARGGGQNRYNLVGLATGFVYAYSIVAALRPEIFSAALRGTHGLVTVYFTAATVVVTLALLVELLAMRRRRGAHG